MLGSVTSLVVLITVPQDKAHELARLLVGERLAGSVNIIGGVQSVYRWAEEIAEEPEAVLVVKTTEERYQELEDCIRSVHTYEIPEIIAMPITRAYPPFLNWLGESVGRR